MKMETNIDPAVTVKPASKDLSNRVGSAAVPNSLKQSMRAKELHDIHARIGEKRLDAAQNLDKIHERLKEISDSLNQEMQSRSKNLKFSVDEITNRMLVTVLDKESGKVLRQIPPEAVLKVAHNLEQLKGIIFDDKY